jgi:hypothetical protein
MVPGPNSTTSICNARVRIQKPGADFLYIVFCGKFRGIFSEKQFFKTFSAENFIFSQHFWGKIFRGISPKIFPRKMYEKSAPVVTYDIVACDKKALCPDLFATGF